MKHVSDISESKIHEFLGNFGIHISPATISRILTKNNEIFDQEKDDIVLAPTFPTVNFPFVMVP